MNMSVPTTMDPTLHIDSDEVMHLHALLTKSLELRIKSIRNIPTSPGRTNFAVLFSGGVDCTLLTRIAHDIVPLDEAVDLLNVAFQNPRIHGDSQVSPYELCPDRQTARSSFAELERMCPGRKFRLIRIDIPFLELSAHRQTIIDLIHPHNTEMDFSIACALYFASRGAGIDDTTGEGSETSARVLLSGLGADELFGGYSRHAIAFARNGFPALLSELELDFSRLGKRNLGRDDRVISHWSKEARFPFLDENLVSWTLELPLRKKCGFTAADEPASREAIVQGTTKLNTSHDLEPGKLILRLLAAKLGMEGAAREKKRAVSGFPRSISISC